MFFGVTFIMTGVTQLLAASRAEGWLWVVGGVLSIVAGILDFAWPERTVLVLAGIYAAAYGFTELFAAFDLRGLEGRGS